MIRVLLLLMLSSCATSGSSLPENVTVISREHSSVKEARNFIRNKWNYLSLLFEQSYDPYYNTPRWPPACLRQNTIGKIEEQKPHSYFLSRFLLNERKEIGFCDGTETEVVFLHCENALKSYEIHCPPGTCGKVLKDKPCSLIK